MKKRMEEKYIVRRTIVTVLAWQGLLIAYLGIFAYWLMH